MRQGKKKTTLVFLFLRTKDILVFLVLLSVSVLYKVYLKSHSMNLDNIANSHVDFPYIKYIIALWRLLLDIYSSEKFVYPLRSFFCVSPAVSLNELRTRLPWPCEVQMDVLVIRTFHCISNAKDGDKHSTGRRVV